MKDAAREIIERQDQLDANYRRSRDQQLRGLPQIPYIVRYVSENTRRSIEHPYVEAGPGLDIDSANNSALVPHNSQVSHATGRSTLARVLVSTGTSTSCSLDCRCTCHRSNRIGSPKLFNRVVGSLFVGYQSKPWFSLPCSYPSCRARSVRITYTYTFPQWLLKSTLYASMTFDCSNGPELILRVMRVRSNSDAIFMTIKFDDSDIALANVQKLMNDKEASVLDVDSFGRTALHVSTI